MLAGHLDEVGFMVSLITDDGFLRFQTLGRLVGSGAAGPAGGGQDPPRRRVGVIGSKPPHVLSPRSAKKLVEKKDMFIDIGAASKEDALAMGMRPGDPIIPESEFTVMKNEKYVDGQGVGQPGRLRAGRGGAAAAARRGPPEYGVRRRHGAGGSGAAGGADQHLAIEPDVGIALEVSIAGDVPGMKPEEAQSKLGGARRAALRRDAGAQRKAAGP